jgi:hypothetical protein
LALVLSLPKLPLPDEQPIAVNALRNRRAKIVGEIEFHQGRIGKLRTDLVHLDATLRLFDPATDPDDIGPRQHRATRTHYFEKGELARRIYAALRESDTTCAIDLAIAAMADREIDKSDTKIRKDFVGRFSNQLHDFGRRRIIERIGNGPGVRWKLATTEPHLI